jgi:hypothetical protein
MQRRGRGRPPGGRADRHARTPRGVHFHFDEQCANRLSLNEFDPISREPNYEQCAVRLEKPEPGLSAGTIGARG